MNKRTLGRTGIEVSEISFGGVEIGVPYGIGIESKADMIAESDAIKLLAEALDEGINFFDTASSYGRSEKLMGEAFKNRRQKAIICTKCGSLLDEDGKLLPTGKLKTIIKDSLKSSLSNLKTDYVDIYMVHYANIETLRNQQVQESFHECKKEGLTRAIGASVYTTEETKEVIDSGLWDVIQVPFNLMDQRQGRLFEPAAKKGVGIVVRSVLLKGVLTDKAEHLHPALKKVKQHRELFKQFLNESIQTLPDLATKFALSYKDVSSVLVGIDRKEYLQKALTVADGNYLDPKTLARARGLEYPDLDFLDLTMWRKKGWLKGY